jgi:glycosyltransferase involved in cell wall biosynthesis
MVKITKIRKIGVVIPCYKHHIRKLKRLLDSIQDQTRRPDLVVVSCSSTKKCEIYGVVDVNKYSFPLKILTHEERLNAAENRNLAAMMMDADMDYISFFDADDIMHPQRLEAIEYVAELGDYDAILHSFLEGEETKVDFVMYSQFMHSEGELERVPSGCLQSKRDPSLRIHQSQITIRRDIFKKVQFEEGLAFERREDAVFCGMVVSLPGVRHAYIYNPLSKYDYEGVWYTS